MADDPLVRQDEIEALLKQAQASGSPAASEASGSSAAPASPADSGLVGQDEIEALLRGASTAAHGTKPAAAPSNLVGQDEIEALLKQTNPGAAAKAQPRPAPAAKAPPQTYADDGDKSKLLGQNEIEELLKQSLGGTASQPTGAVSNAASPASAAAAAGVGDAGVASADIELLLQQAEAALRSIDQPMAAATPPGVKLFKLEEFAGAPPSPESATLELLRDVELDVKIELGRTHMFLEDVLKLRRGSVVPLDKLAGDPVDIFVNGRLIARGEVLVLNDNFSVRVAELVAGESAAAG